MFNRRGQILCCAGYGLDRPRAGDDRRTGAGLYSGSLELERVQPGEHISTSAIALAPGDRRRKAEHYLGSGTTARSSIASQDKTWSGRGVDVAAKIEQVRQKDARVALQLALQLAFGLRAREAMQLRPHIADQGVYLSITHGTKGGRDRAEPIRTPEQRALLDLAKTFCATRSSSTSDPQRNLAQWKNHYYQVVRACGITREDGITSHGLRHQYANERYRDLTGSDSPVRGGARVDRDTDRAAREVVAGELGHSRESVTTHYLGR